MNTQTWNAITFDYDKLPWYDKPFMRVRTALPIFITYVVLAVVLAVHFQSFLILVAFILFDGYFMFYINPRQHNLRIMWHTRQALDALLAAQHG